MSSLVYGAQTASRINTEPAKADKKTFLDGLSALVPAEALAAFALLETNFTSNTKGETDATSTVVVENTTRAWQAYGFCSAVAVVAYVVGRFIVGKANFTKGEFLRLPIPAAAFFGVFMWQYTPIFRATFGNITDKDAAFFGVMLSVALGLLALALGFTANNTVTDNGGGGGGGGGGGNGGGGNGGGGNGGGG